MNLVWFAFLVNVYSSQISGFKISTKVTADEYYDESSAIIQTYDVAIIGAGMSGLSAAQYLSENGVNNFVVFEASNRIGGRIYTKHFKTGPLEMGAQWIHGASLVNVIYNLANRHKLINNESCLSHDGPFITDDGKHVSKQLLHRVYEDIANIDALPESKMSTEEYLSKPFDKILAKYSNEEISSVKQILNSYKVLKMFYEGDEMSLISSKDEYMRIPCDIDLNSGNDKLLEKLIADLDSSKILLKHEVMNVKYNSNGTLLTVKNKNKIFRVKANHVICTVSLGVLKGEMKTMFTPELPKTKVIAIQNIHFGRGVKIYLYYENPFWKRNSLVYLTLGINDEDYKNSNNNWLNRIAEFYELPDNENVLLTVAYGNVAEKVEALKNSEIGIGITERLRNYTGDFTIPEPTVVFKSNWIHNRFFRGVYSSPSPRGNGNEFDVLSNPIPSANNPRLLFAGEATVKQYYGTMHAARRSGVREAMRIVKYKIGS